MCNCVSNAFARNPAIEQLYHCHFPLGTINTDWAHGNGCVFLKPWLVVLIAIHLPQQTPLSASHSHTHTEQNNNCTYNWWRWSWWSCLQPSFQQWTLIQMCLKFPLRRTDRLAGELEGDTKAVASHSGPSLDWISIVVQLYHQVLWLQEGEDTGHHTRQGSTFFAAWGASTSGSVKAQNWQAVHKSLNKSCLKWDTHRNTGTSAKAFHTQAQIFTHNYTHTIIH